jgi:putative restriction endonuclease
MDSALENELKWRMEKWDELQSLPNWPKVSPGQIRELDLYAGMAGVYRDANRTGKLMQDGITVSILNTSGNYTDEVTDNRLIYSYPNTLRHPSNDKGEIQSLKNAMAIQMPIFVISEIAGGLRNVNLGWIEGCEDKASCALVKLDEAPENIVNVNNELELQFEAKISRKLKLIEVQKIERDPKFKFNALSLYGSTCAVTDVTVERMLDAAHVVPVSENGSDHPRNSLLLSSSVHRAFDSHYWSIEPETFQLATRKIGPTLNQMKISRSSISHLRSKPHPEALQIRWDKFMKVTSGKIDLAS